MTLAVQPVATQVSEPPISVVAAERPLRRLTLDDYHWLIEHGFFQPQDRVELIEGYLVEISPFHPRQAGAVDAMMEALMFAVQRQAQVRIQQPITLPEQSTEPEPDFVLALRQENYRLKHPHPDDIYLVGEVSDSTLLYDRGKKAQLYAAARIPEYWIVNMVDNVLEVYREPMGSRGNADYRIKLTYMATDAIAPLALPACSIQLATILL